LNWRPSWRTQLPFEFVTFHGAGDDEVVLSPNADEVFFDTSRCGDERPCAPGEIGVEGEEAPPP